MFFIVTVLSLACLVQVVLLKDVKKPPKKSEPWLCSKFWTTLPSWCQTRESKRIQNCWNWSDIVGPWSDDAHNINCIFN
jgi:hypothetical protein